MTLDNVELYDMHTSYRLTFWGSQDQDHIISARLYASKYFTVGVLLMYQNSSPTFLQTLYDTYMGVSCLSNAYY